MSPETSRATLKSLRDQPPSVLPLHFQAPSLPLPPQPLMLIYPNPFMPISSPSPLILISSIPLGAHLFQPQPPHTLNSFSHSRRSAPTVTLRGSFFTCTHQSKHGMGRASVGFKGRGRGRAGGVQGRRLTNRRQLRSSAVLSFADQVCNISSSLLHHCSPGRNSHPAHHLPVSPSWRSLRPPRMSVTAAQATTRCWYRPGRAPRCP